MATVSLFFIAILSVCVLLDFHSFSLHFINELTTIILSSPMGTTGSSPGLLLLFLVFLGLLQAFFKDIHIYIYTCIYLENISVLVPFY